MPAGGARPWVEPEPVPLAALARVRLPPRLRRDDAVAELFERGKPAVDKGVVPPRDCSTKSGYLPMRFETISLTRDGATLFVITDALVDASTCRLRVISRTEVPARSIAGGLAFAFVSTPFEPGSDLPDRLEVVTPHSGALATSSNDIDVVVSWGLVRTSLPLRRGSTASIATVIYRYTLQDWLEMTTPSTDAKLALQRFVGMTDMTVIVEVGQGVRDRAPLAIAFVRRPYF